MVFSSEVSGEHQIIVKIAKAPTGHFLCLRGITDLCAEVDGRTALAGNAEELTPYLWYRL